VFSGLLSKVLRILGELGPTFPRVDASIYDSRRTARPIGVAPGKLAGQTAARRAIRTRCARPVDVVERHPARLRLRAAAAIRADQVVGLAGDLAAGRNHRF